MSTPIYKVTDGSTITFIKTGPRVQAKLTTVDGQIFTSDFLSSSTSDVYSKLAKEIQLAHNIVDNTGTPLPYTEENPPDLNATNNYLYEIPKITISEAPDETALNTAKVNNDIASENSKVIKSNVNSQVPPKVRLVNFINNNKTTIQKRLVPFIIKLLMAFGSEVVQGLIGKIPVDKLKNLIDCPSANQIDQIIKKRNKLVKQINNMYNVVKTLTVIITGLNIFLTVLQVGITAAKALPYPATGVPPLGLPPLTAGMQNTLSDSLRIAQEQLKATQKIVSIVNISIATFGILLGIILKLLNNLDELLQHCAQNKNMDLETLNDEINNLANASVEKSQTPEGDTYKGFKLEVIINEKNTSKFIQRYAQAINKQGVPVLKTEPSFASSPQVLIDNLKFIIDSNPNITAE